MSKRTNCSPALAVCALLCALGGSTSAQATQLHRFRSCAEMNALYPHGVGTRHAVDRVGPGQRRSTSFTRNDALYAATGRSLDRDHDGIACEHSASASNPSVPEPTAVIAVPQTRTTTAKTSVPALTVPLVPPISGASGAGTPTATVPSSTMTPAGTPVTPQVPVTECNPRFAIACAKP